VNVPRLAKIVLAITLIVSAEPAVPPLVEPPPPPPATALPERKIKFDADDVLGIKDTKLCCPDEPDVATIPPKPPTPPTPVYI